MAARWRRRRATVKAGAPATLSNLQRGAAGAAAAYATALVSTRRVVTGHDASGKSVFASDELLEPETVAMFPGWAQKLLRAGDSVVQNGTRHRWRNPGTEPCLMAIFMVGARRR